jgi:hypothetical protein
MSTGLGARAWADVRAMATTKEKDTSVMALSYNAVKSVPALPGNQKN